MKKICITVLAVFFVSSVFAGQDDRVMTADDIAEKFRADDTNNAKILFAKCEERKDDADGTLVCLGKYEKYIKYETARDYPNSYRSFKKSILLSSSLKSHQKVSSLLENMDLVAAKREMERRDFLLEMAKDLEADR